MRDARGIEPICLEDCGMDVKDWSREELEQAWHMQRARLEKWGKAIERMSKKISRLKGLADTSVTERLAEYAHEAWSGWMRYMFKKGTLMGNGALVIPKELAIRWNRQMTTGYKDLPEEEKNSDRQEARKMITIFCKKQV